MIIPLEDYTLKELNTIFQKGLKDVKLTIRIQFLHCLSKKVSLLNLDWNFIHELGLKTLSTIQSQSLSLLDPKNTTISFLEGILYAQILLNSCFLLGEILFS